LTFCAVVQMHGVLTPENEERLLTRLVGKSRAEIQPILVEYRPPRKVADQAKPTVVKRLVAVEGAPAGAISSGAAGAGSSKLGEIPRHCEGVFHPTVKNSTPGQFQATILSVIGARSLQIRFAQTLVFHYIATK
jgi:hypothetical protein